MIFKPRVIAIGCTILLGCSAPGLYADDAGIPGISVLQRQQQNDAMSLSIGQGLSSAQATNLDQRQRQQLQQLELQQRMQQQQLEQQQVRQASSRELLRSQPLLTRDAQVQTEQRQFSQERRQQLQHFEWERQQQLQQYQWERQQQQSLTKPLVPRPFTLR